MMQGLRQGLGLLLLQLQLQLQALLECQLLLQLPEVQVL
jgi:hypothetical protein